MVGIVFVVVCIPLIANTVGAYALSLLTARAQTVAQEWIATIPGAQVESVAFYSRTCTSMCRHPMGSYRQPEI